MKALVDSGAHAGDAETLRARLGVDGYLFFHGLTSHAALPNRAGRLRVSQDSRWQAAGQPAPARLVYGPKRPERGEMLSRLLGRHRWWEPIPAGQPIAGHAASAGAAPWSRFFPVDPRWAGRAGTGARTDVR
jgi:hypothetical protein